MLRKRSAQIHLEGPALLVMKNPIGFCDCVDLEQTIRPALFCQTGAARKQALPHL